MKFIQKLVLGLTIAGLLVPSFATAASTTSSSTSCLNALKQVNKTYTKEIKDSDKTFSASVKSAEKIYKDAIKSGVQKATAFETLRNTTWQAFVIQRDANDTSVSARVQYFGNNSAECFKSYPSTYNKTKVVQTCTDFLKAYVSDFNSLLSQRSKNFKLVHPYSEESVQFMQNHNDALAELKDMKKNYKSLCNEYYAINFSPGGSGTGTYSDADAKRVADVRQIASALELYYNDNNTYPTSLSLLAPNIISTVPVAPAKSGSCSQTQNTYTYTFIDSGTYKLTFCLGKSTAGLTSGVHTLSQGGIQ